MNEIMQSSSDAQSPKPVATLVAEVVLKKKEQRNSQYHDEHGIVW